MPNPNHTPWTAEELDRLRLAYESWPPRYDLLPGRSRSSVWTLANKLGLSNRKVVPACLTERTPAEWAYLAAFIDGEGSIVMGYARTVAKVVITNTDRPVVEWLNERFPGGSWSTYTRDGERERKGFRGETKPIHHLSWVRHDLVYELLLGIRPYMIIKRDKADVALRKLRENFPALARYDAA